MGTKVASGELKKGPQAPSALACEPDASQLSGFAASSLICIELRKSLCRRRLPDTDNERVRYRMFRSIFHIPDRALRLCKEQSAVSYTILSVRQRRVRCLEGNQIELWLSTTMEEIRRTSQRFSTRSYSSAEQQGRGRGRSERRRFRERPFGRVLSSRTPSPAV